MKRGNRKMKGNIQAGAGLTQIQLDCEPSEIEFAAAAAVADGDSPRLPRFKMVAYTGGEIRQWGETYVIDLEGTSIPKTGIPVRVHHDPSQGAGHTEKIEVKNGRLLLEGIISRDTEAAREVVVSAGRGFPWQASVGMDIQASESVAEKTSVTVNGKTFKGPLFVLRKTSLEEVSFVDRGADGKTSARIAAQRAEGGEAMICKLCKSETCDGNCIKDGVVNPEPKKVEASGGGKPLDDAGASVVDSKDSSKEPTPKVQPVLEATADTIAEMKAAMRTEMVVEQARITDIQKICDGECRDLEAKAISEGWTVEKCELEKLRASRPKPVGIHFDRSAVTGKVLEAAVHVAAGDSRVEKKYDEETLDRAHKRFRGGIGLHDLLLEAAWANGYTGRTFKGNELAVLGAAMPPRNSLQAGVSLIDLSGILGNVANTFLLEGFNGVEQVWKEVSSRRSVTNFQAVTSYRLTGATRFDELAPGGEIKHGKLGEESFANQIITYAQILNIDRRDIINDDLGALTAVPRMQGRAAGIKLNEIFWAEFMDNSAFFHAVNYSNYITGATTNLGIAGLTLGEQEFMDLVDADGKPTGVQPQILLVPTALSAIAAQLFNSTELRPTGTTSTTFPTANPHANKFKVHVSAYLGNSDYTGYGAKIWYLLADPNNLPVIEVAFLKGREVPTIESADADFNTLGIQLRGYHDFGVALQDQKAGIKSKGEA